MGAATLENSLEASQAVKHGSTTGPSNFTPRYIHAHEKEEHVSTQNPVHRRSWQQYLQQPKSRQENPDAHQWMYGIYLQRSIFTIYFSTEINEVLTRATTGMNLETMMLREESIHKDRILYDSNNAECPE